MKKYVEKECKNCKAIFTTSQTNSNKKFCSKNCASKWHNSSRRGDIYKEAYIAYLLDKKGLIFNNIEARNKAIDQYVATNWETKEVKKPEKETQLPLELPAPS